MTKWAFCEERVGGVTTPIFFHKMPNLLLNSLERRAWSSETLFL